MAVVAICICTFRREQLLKECLGSVARLSKPNDVDLHVVTIDNDANETSRGYVESCRGSYPFALHYVCESRRGIPCARNRAIDISHDLGADYFIFIDDDERVEPGWLVMLVEYCFSKGGRAVVHGGVESVLPVNTPDHIKAVYERKKKKTGQRLNTCATNNVIVPVWVTKELGLRFDESNPLAGGTDTVFFTEAVAKGVEIFECAEALVKETVPESRATLKWLSKRKYRAGITEAWRKQQKGRLPVGVFLSSAVQLLIEVIKAGLMAVLGQNIQRNKFWLKACRSVGVLAGLLGVRVDSYGNIDS